MAEPPRRPPGGQPPSKKTQQLVSLDRPAPTQPRVTTPMGTQRAKAIADKILAEDDTHMDPGPTTRTQKFLPEELVKTTLSPSQQLRLQQQQQARARVTTPMGTAASERLSSERAPERAAPERVTIPDRMRVTTPMGTPVSERPTLRDQPVVPVVIERTIVPERIRNTTPMGTAASEPPANTQPSVIVSPQQALTREVPAELLKQLAAEGNAEIRVSSALVPRRTPVWVATHRGTEDPDARLIMVRAPDSPAAASFRVLRHRLQERGDPRVIAVTSAAPREGKTTCAVNLALALGECGRARVLLVEANLRAPSLAPLFGFMPPQCFSVQMQKHKDKPTDGWSVVEVFSEYLHVLAVEPSDRGRPLLDGPAFAIAMEMLQQAGYDYIVVDTPPVIGAADVNLIEDSADGVLLTAWARSTSSRALRQAVDQLAASKLLGVTLLDV